MTFSVWIQTADYETAVTESDVSPGRALALFDGYDWAEALRRESEFIQDGVDNCPPGLGVVDDVSGDILHLCPRGKDAVLAYHHTTRRARLLGLFTRDRRVTGVVQNLPRDVARQAIGRFMQRDTAWIARIFAPDQQGA